VIADNLLNDLLEDLDLETSMPGEVLHRKSKGVHFYGVNGEHLSDDLVESARSFEALRFSGQHHFVTSLWFNDIPFEVSTVYLGIDLSMFSPGPPVVWETMIFPGLGRLESYQMRYCTQAAAFDSHEKIVARLLENNFVLAGEAGQASELPQ